MTQFLNRLKLALVIFGLAGLIGPFLHFVGASYYLTSPLWPMWILGVYEASVGRSAAYILTISSNIALFMLIGLFSAIPSKRTAYVTVSALSLVCLLFVSQWRYGDQIVSYVILAMFLFTIFLIYGVKVRILKVQ